MTPSCPSDLALEAHLLEPAASALAPHLAGCAACADRLAAMERQGEDFRRFVYPATVGRVEEAAARGRRPWWILAPAPVLAAAALAVVLLRPTGPADDYLGVKGAPGGLGLTVFTHGDSGARPLADGAHLPAHAAVRFRIRSARPCRLYLLSVDPGGQVSRLHPSFADAPQADAAELPAGEHDLPGGALLDGKAGPERFYAVCAGALAWPEVEELTRSAAGGGPEAVRRGAALEGAAAKLPQASVLLEKEAP
jgi:hypothetical protein